MSRLSTTLELKLSAEMQSKYETATKSASGLPATFQALFANPQAGSGLAARPETARQPAPGPRACSCGCPPYALALLAYVLPTLLPKAQVTYSLKIWKINNNQSLTPPSKSGRPYCTPGSRPAGRGST